MGSSFKCFGAAPLENIVKNRKNLIMEDLENALAQQAPAIPHTNPDLHELPPLVSSLKFVNTVISLHGNYIIYSYRSFLMKY